MSDWEQLRLEAERRQQEGNKEATEAAWLSVLEAAQDFGEFDQRYVFSLETVAEFYFAHENYTKAEPHCLKLLEVSREKLGENDQDVAIIIANLAMLYHALDQLEKAEEYYQKAWTMRQGSRTPQSQIMHLVSNYCRLLETTGRKSEAETIKSAAESMSTGKWSRSGHYEALSLKEIKTEGQAPDALPDVTAAALRTAVHIDGEAASAMRKWNLLMTEGEKAQESDELAHAEEAFAEALDIARTFDKHDGRMMMSLESLTEVVWQQGKHKEAEPLCRLTLELYEDQLGPDHLDVGVIANNLALLYHTIKDYDAAEPLYKRSLTTRIACQGATHPEVLTLMNNYANLLYSTNRESEGSNLKAHIRSLSSGKWNRCGQFQAMAPHLIKATDTANLEELRLMTKKTEPGEPIKPKGGDSGSIYDRLVEAIDKRKNNPLNP